MNTREIKLWDEAPLLIPDGEVPTMTYFPAEKRCGRGALVIFAGGGYSHRTPRESVNYAQYFNKEGIDCFVVEYRIIPYTFPCALLDARRAIRVVRSMADELGIDKDKIAVMGSSAGGHLAALVSTYRGAIDGEGVDEIDNIDPTPNGQILCYPVLDPLGNLGSFINMLGQDKYKLNWRSITPNIIADEKTPPAFMWHCENDMAVDVRTTIRYSMKLVDLGVSQETHIYPRGAHGIGLVDDERFFAHEYMKSWAVMCTAWLKLQGFID